MENFSWKQWWLEQHPASRAAAAVKSAAMGSGWCRQQGPSPVLSAPLPAPPPRQCSYGVIFWLLSGCPVSLVSTCFLSLILQLSWEFSEIPSVLSINSLSAQMMRQGWFLSHTAGNPN